MIAVVIAKKEEDSSSSSSSSSSGGSGGIATSNYMTSSSSSSSVITPLLSLNFTQVIPISSGLSFVRKNAHMRRVISSATSAFYYKDPQSNATKYVEPSEQAFLYFGGDSYNDVWLGRVGGTYWLQLMGSNLESSYNTTFTPGTSMALCSFRDNTLIALCGLCLPDDATDDVFASQLIAHESATQNWKYINTTAWQPRQSSSCTSDAYYLYHIAGNDWSSGFDTNSVWRSSDRGISWIQTTAQASFSPRSEPSLLTYYSTTFKYTILYVIGGRIGSQQGPLGLNDVWVSGDSGLTFNVVTTNAAWAARMNPALAITSDGVIALIGGQIRQSLNDVWITVDGGYHWHRMAGQRAFTRRYAFTAVFDSNNFLYFAGGVADDNNDMWISNVRFNNVTALSLLIYNVPNNITSLGLQVWPSVAPDPRPSTSDTPVAGILIGFAVFIVVFGGFTLYKFVDWQHLPCMKHRWVAQSHLVQQTTNTTNTLNQQLLVRSDRASFID